MIWGCWYAVLLNQIMQLSPAQIDGLPPEQKAQVLALQQQMVSLPLFPEFCVGPAVELVSAVSCNMRPRDCWIIDICIIINNFSASVHICSARLFCCWVAAVSCCQCCNDGFVVHL